MKVFILTKIRSGAWGGANQFLKALKKEFETLGIYASSVYDADVVLFNSYQDLGKVLKLKLKYPNKIFVHRLGPIFKLHRPKHWGLVDRLVVSVANKMANGVIFQSKWSLDRSVRVGFDESKSSIVIGNAPDQSIFYPKEVLQNDKTKLIAASWSGNPKKGMEYYKYLDENLDFSKYEMTFVGNNKYNFKNINNLGAIDSPALANKLREHDIFISAARDEAYSNAIIEALSCGLPVVAIDSGSSDEVVRAGGGLFTDKNDLIEKIDQVSSDIDYYKSKIEVKSVKQIAREYRDFFVNLPTRQVSLVSMLLMLSKVIVVNNLMKVLDRIS